MLEHLLGSAVVLAVHRCISGLFKPTPIPTPQSIAKLQSEKDKKEDKCKERQKEERRKRIFYGQPDVSVDVYAHDDDIPHHIMLFNKYRHLYFHSHDYSFDDISAYNVETKTIELQAGIERKGAGFVSHQAESFTGHVVTLALKSGASDAVILRSAESAQALTELLNSMKLEGEDDKAE